MSEMKASKEFTKGIWRGFRDFGTFITNSINVILLGIVYFLGIGISAVIAKLTGKHFLDLGNTKKSQWHKKKNITDQDEYYRQF